MKIEYQWFLDNRIISATEEEKEKLRLFHFEVNINTHEKKEQQNPIHAHATAKEVGGIRSVHIEGNKLAHSLQVTSSSGFKEFRKIDPTTADKVEVCLKCMIEKAKELIRS